MSRRLNPQLFEDKTPTSAEVEIPYSAVANRRLEEQMKGMRKSISHLESLVEVLQSQMAQFITTSDKRTEAFSKAISELERSSHNQDLELARKTRHLQEQLAERRSVDAKTEAMVDRFNMNLQQFENKLMTLQKVLSEKEMTLMSYRRVIEQIVDEVEKLKASRY
ncbi:MAG: hypothetical protein KDD33_01385 [Bdellovibrionales bacterium]|nr:hypothetical protein [Bdellovibrionales bacterium]